MSRNPIVYVGGPGYSFEAFEPIISEINDHFDDILDNLKITDNLGNRVHINLIVQAENSCEIFASARRAPTLSKQYEVRMTAGLIYHLWLSSRALESDFKYIKWIDKLKVEKSSDKGLSRKKLLADYVFYISSYLFLLHEVSHVVLGHCDYIKDTLDFEWLEEFDELSYLNKEILAIRQAFEAEADRQAGEFLVGFFENSLGSKGLGNHIKFPSRAHVYEFYVFALTIACVSLQQLGDTKKSVHLSPAERLYVFVSSISPALVKLAPEQASVLSQKSFLTMFESARSLGLIDASDPIKVIDSAVNLGWVDDVVKDIGIRDLQFCLD